jgi:hypothetical protein
MQNNSKTRFGEARGFSRKVSMPRFPFRCLKGAPFESAAVLNKRSCSEQSRGGNVNIALAMPLQPLRSGLHPGQTLHNSGRITTSSSRGYGKDGKRLSAFHLFHNPHFLHGPNPSDQVQGNSPLKQDSRPPRLYKSEALAKPGPSSPISLPVLMSGPLLPDRSLALRPRPTV